MSWHRNVRPRFTNNSYRLRRSALYVYPGQLMDDDELEAVLQAPTGSFPMRGGFVVAYRCHSATGGRHATLRVTFALVWIHNGPHVIEFNVVESGAFGVIGGMYDPGGDWEPYLEHDIASIIQDRRRSWVAWGRRNDDWYDPA